MGTLGLSWSATWRHWTFALSASSWAKAVATKAETTRRPWRPALASRLRAKCARHLCQVAPRSPGRGGLQALVVVGDHQLHAAQPAPGQRAQELSPEGLGLRRADRHAQDLTPALVVDGHSHGHRDRDDASGLAHLHISRIQPQIGPVALQRSIEEAVDLIVDLAAQPGDLLLETPDIPIA